MTLGFKQKCASDNSGCLGFISGPAWLMHLLLLHTHHHPLLLLLLLCRLKGLWLWAHGAP